MKCENCGQDVKYPSEHWQDAIMPDDFEGWLCKKLQSKRVVGVKYK